MTEVLVTILTLLGMGYGVYRGVRWMLKAGQVQKQQPLTTNDLKVLEESAARLITEVCVATDECVARIEQALAQADARLRDAPPAPTYQVVTDANQSPALIAREAGMTTGEVELLRALQAIDTRK